MTTLSTEALARHQAFWDRKPTDRPLLGINVGFALQDAFPRVMARMADGPLRPDDIPADALFQDCDALEVAHRGLGDYPFTVAPLVAIPWMEAIAGCQIAASRNSFWAEPCVENWREWKWPRSFLDNPWTRKLMELMDALVAHVAGRCPVTHTLMRGTSDILAAMRGGARFVLDLVDEPAAVDHAISEVSRLWEELATAQLQRIPASDQGYVAGAAALRAWAPHKTLWLQEDAMSLLSPTLYARHILPADRRISESFPGVAFHLHSSALWAIDSLVQLGDVQAIELNLEDANCDIDGTFAGWQRIQQYKPVIVWRMYGRDFEAWLRRVLEELSWDGLSIQVSTRNREEGQTVQQVFDRTVAKCEKRR